MNWYNCVCNTCQSEFRNKHNIRKRCFDCKPKNQKHTKESILAKAKGKTLVEFRDLYSSEWSIAVANGYNSEITEITGLQRIEWTLDLIQLEASKYLHKSDFEKGSFAAYNAWLNRGRPDGICNHMENKLHYWTDSEILEIAAQYETVKEFFKHDAKAYDASIRRGLSLEINKNMIRLYGGWSKSKFQAACSPSDYGIFYIIKCFDDLESFYKFGITSRSVESRYSQFVYDYEELVVLNLPSDACWSFERLFKSRTKPYKYLPELAFAGMTECFKCNKNNKLLQF